MFIYGSLFFEFPCMRLVSLNCNEIEFAGIGEIVISYFGFGMKWTVNRLVKLLNPLTWKTM